jgi:hypothetical protein
MSAMAYGDEGEDVKPVMFYKSVPDIQFSVSTYQEDIWGR